MMRLDIRINANEFMIPTNIKDIKNIEETPADYNVIKEIRTENPAEKKKMFDKKRRRFKTERQQREI
jgi:hypothetical protein